MFPWPVFKVSGPRGTGTTKGTGTGTGNRTPRYPSAQGQCPGRRDRGQTRTLEREWLPIWALRATMGCGAKRAREASKERSNATRGTCPTELASHHCSYGQLLVYTGLGRRQGGGCPSQPPVQHVGPARPARPGHRTEGKAREGSRNLGLPISNLTATRTPETSPTANSICTEYFVFC